MLAGFKKHGEALAFAAERAANLERLLEREQELNIKQEQLKAELSKVTAELYEGLAEGRREYSALMRFAKAKYGPNSLEIGDFISKGED